MEENFKLEPADVLVNINNSSVPYLIVKRWAVGPYDHVFMYMGQVLILVDGVILRHPMLFESNGRGVVIQSLSNRYGQKVVVLRLKSAFNRRRISQVLQEAIYLASNSQSYYDYYAIIKWVLPRILREKLYIPIPIAWHRDARQICSEAVFEVFYRAGLVDILLPDCIPPLPGDFVTDSLPFTEMGRIVLSDGVV